MFGMFGKNLLTTNDQPGVYPSSYYAATATAFPEQPPLTNNVRADIAIIGGGLTGLSAAYHAAKLGYAVVVLEANRVGWGASGRNGGQLGTGQRVEQPELETLVGKTAARALWDLGLDSVQLCRDLIAEHQIDCGLANGIIHADHKKRYSRHSREFVDKLREDYQYDNIDYLDQNRIREYVDSPAYYSGSIDHGAAHCHPLNFTLGIAQAAINAGATLYENTLVTDFTPGNPVNITTNCNRTNNKATVTADALIIGCNGYLDKLSPSIAKKVMPINNFILATEPLDTALAERLIKDNAAVADSKFVVNYFRLSQDQRLLFGGGETVTYRFPADIKGFVRKNMLEIYPQLADTRIDYGWGGTLAITMNRMPYLDRLDGNILTASGYSGHGVALSTLSGKILADAINGQLSNFDLMNQVPSPNLPGGPLLRWPALATAMTYYSMLDKLP